MKSVSLIFFCFCICCFSCYAQMFATGNGGGKMANCIVTGPHITLINKFISFDVICLGDKREVRWSYASSLSKSYFVIERSTDRIHFQAVSTITEKANSTRAGYYNFIDNPTGCTSYYYRIKRTGINESSTEYSPVASSNCCVNKNAVIVLYPNPTPGSLNISAAETITRVTIRNILGQFILTKTTSSSFANINLSYLPDGIYIVETVTKQDTSYGTVVLKKK